MRLASILTYLCSEGGGKEGVGGGRVEGERGEGEKTEISVGRK